MHASTRIPTGDGPVTGSAVTSVVVHSSGAVCTRTARLDLPAGAAAVRVTGLPPTLHEDSLRGRVVSGPEGLRINDIRVEFGAALRRGDDLPRLRLDLEDAEDRQSRLRDRRDRLTAEVAEVAALRAEAPLPRRGDPPRWAPVESILALAGFVDSRLSVLHRRLRAVEDELAEADHAADVLHHRLTEASTATSAARTAPSATALVTFAHGPDDTGGAPGPDGARPGADGTEAGPTGGGPADSASASGGSKDAGQADWADRTGDGASGPQASGGADAKQADGTGWTAGSTPGTPAPQPFGPQAPQASGSAEAGQASGGGADAGQSVAVELELEYHVPGATWTPVYQLRLDGRSGAGTLVLRACVAQRVGEDWTGVRLGLSTADLLRRADLPELRSLRIGRRQEEPAHLSWREPPAGLDDLFAGYDAAAVAAPVTRGLDVPLPVSAPAPVPPPMPAAVGGYGAAPAAPRPRAAMARAGLAAAAPGGPALESDAFAGGPAVQPSPFAPAGPGGPGGPAEPPSPGADLLDYARLTLAGPDAPTGRGTLRPAPRAAHPAAAEHQRRAASVAGLARPAHAVDVRASAGSFDYRFDTAAPVDVAADGRWHTVPVSEVPVSTEFEYVCVPAVDPAVFGTVLVTNDSAHALLAGPVDVMVDGDFVLTAPLPTLAPGQRQAVGVGVAESVKVARRAHMRESTAGLRGGTTVLDHTVEIDVANRLPYPVVVQVRERVPVSADKDVRIEEHKASPPWTPAERPVDGQEDDYVRGVRSWRVALEAGGTATLSGGYGIRLPAGKAVVGGNRRN